VKILFVAPNRSGSGEALTALQMGRELRRTGHDVRYLASRFTSPFLKTLFRGEVDELSGEAREERRLWQRLVLRFAPQVVVFADYPLLLLSSEGRDLAANDSLKLDDLDAEVVTLDHLGMAQGPLTLPFGPPHLDLLPQHLPAMPARMKVLLPCPVQSPEPVPGRRGMPFRWDQLLRLPRERRRTMRERFAEGPDGLLVFHSVPAWAQELCRRHGLPNYRYLTRLFETYFGDLQRPVTVVSVNHDSLLAPSTAPELRIINVGRLKPDEYQDLLLASDLMITDNRVSVSLGRAVCGLIPCAVLRNSYRLLELLEWADRRVRRLLLEMENQRLGSVFPFEVFPIWSREDLDALRLFVGNPLAECVAALEIYGGDETRRALEALLTDPTRREELRSRQSDYVSSLSCLPGTEEALLTLTE
jgi:hypothetical protein